MGQLLSMSKSKVFFSVLNMMPSNFMHELYFSIKMEIHTVYDNYSIINCTLKYK